MDDLVETAMRLFWARGYAATSLSDIYTANCLAPGSLYAVFRSEEELFRRAFERYADLFPSTLPQGCAAGRRSRPGWRCRSAGAPRIPPGAAA